MGAILDLRVGIIVDPDDPKKSCKSLALEPPGTGVAFGSFLFPIAAQSFALVSAVAATVIAQAGETVQCVTVSAISKPRP